ncbi:MAG: acyl-CoA carboxylase subunit epsilon [Corynebacterium sp.]|nr:acyl-CoA carboxylase subunit epsilon [Corynebacterium sp.]
MTAKKTPFLTVVKGNPSHSEVAALTAVFSSMAAVAADTKERTTHRNQWGRRSESFSPTSFRNVSFY